MENISKRINQVVVLSFAAVVLWIVFLCLFRLDISSMDHGGHLSNARQFREVGYHGYSDHTFKGLVQGLFYPLGPALVVNIFYSLPGLSWDLAYRCYLALAALFYLMSLFLFSRILKHSIWQSIFLMGAMFIFFLTGPHASWVLGLNWSSFYKVGLVNQFISTAFWFLFWRDFYREKGPLRLAVWSIGIIAFHIVTFLFNIYLLAFVFIFNKEWRKKIFTSQLIATSCSAFILMPFIAYSGLVSSSQILSRDKEWIILFCALGLFISVYKNREVRAALLALGLLLLPVGLDSLGLTKMKDILPVFHWYRFTIQVVVALWMFSVFFLDRDSSKKSRIAVGLLWGLFFMLNYPNPKNLFHLHHTRPEQVTALENLDTKSSLTRLWGISHLGPDNKSLEMYWQAQNSNLLTVKGLFWETNKSQYLLSTYLVTLDGTPNVIDYSYYTGLNCSMFNCFLDQFIREYQIGHLFLPKEMVYRKTYRKRGDDFYDLKFQCLDQVINAGGTSHHAIKNVESFRYDERPYDLYQIKPTSGVAETWARAWNPKQWHLEGVDLKRPVRVELGTSYVDSVYQSCVRNYGITQYVRQKDLPQAQEWSQLSSDRDLSIPFKRLRSGEYTLALPDELTTFLVQLYYYPGLSLESMDGTIKYPLIWASSGVMGRAKGDVRLVYRRTGLMVFSYVVSFISVVLFIFYYRRKTLK